MNKDACFELGYIVKKHGLQGELSIYLDTDQPEYYTTLESVFVEINQKLVPFFIDTISLSGDRALVKFEEVNTVEEAEELKGKKIFLPLNILPPLSGKDFYFHEVIGFTVTDKSSGELGKINDVLDAAAQNLFSLEYNGKEILIPVNDDIIIEVKRTEKEIIVDLPEGLLDVYME